MIIPHGYAYSRHSTNAYVRGYKAGQLADLGGVPLAPYVRQQMVLIFEAGFKAAQRDKAQPVEILPPPVPPGLFGRERELLAFLEQVRQDITAILGVPRCQG